MKIFRCLKNGTSELAMQPARISFRAKNDMSLPCAEESADLGDATAGARRSISSGQE